MLSKFVAHDLLESHKKRLVNNAGNGSHIRIITANFQTLTIPSSYIPPISKPIDRHHHYIDEFIQPLEHHKPPQDVSDPKLKPIQQRPEARKPKQLLKLENYVFGPKRLVIQRDDSHQKSQFDLARRASSIFDLRPSESQLPISKMKSEYHQQKLEIQLLSMNLRRKGLHIEEATLERALLRPKEQAVLRKTPRYIKAVQQQLLVEKMPVSLMETVQSATKKQIAPVIEQRKVDKPIEYRPLIVNTKKSRRKGTFMTLMANPVEVEENLDDFPLNQIPVKVNTWWTKGHAHRIRAQTEDLKRIRSEKRYRKLSEEPVKYKKSFGHVEQSLTIDRQRSVSLMKEYAEKSSWSYSQPAPSSQTPKSTSASFFESTILPKINVHIQSYSPSVQLEHTSFMSSKSKIYRI